MFLSDAINNGIVTETKLTVNDSFDADMFCFRVIEQPTTWYPITLSAGNNDICCSQHHLIEINPYDGAVCVNTCTTAYVDRVSELERRIEQLERMVQEGGDNRAPE